MWSSRRMKIRQEKEVFRLFRENWEELYPSTASILKGWRDQNGSRRRAVTVQLSSSGIVWEFPARSNQCKSEKATLIPEQSFPYGAPLDRSRGNARNSTSLLPLFLTLLPFSYRALYRLQGNRATKFDLIESFVISYLPSAHTTVSHRIRAIRIWLYSSRKLRSSMEERSRIENGNLPGGEERN